MKIFIKLDNIIKIIEEKELAMFSILLFNHDYLNINNVTHNIEMNNILFKIRDKESYLRIYPIHLIFKTYTTDDFINLINKSEKVRAKKVTVI